MPDILKTQVGGNHYSKLAMQPCEIAEALRLPFMLANAVKYVTRYKDKGGVEDLKKALHCLEVYKDQKVDRQIKEYKARALYLDQFKDDMNHYMALSKLLKDDVVEAETVLKKMISEEEA